MTARSPWVATAWASCCSSATRTWPSGVLGRCGVWASSTAGMPAPKLYTLPGNSSTARSASAVVMAWCSSAGASVRQALAV